MSASRPIPGDIADHARFLRAIGRHLVMGEDQIDDALQTTLLTSLTRGPRDDHRIRPWLSTVFRNAAKQSYRAEDRRTKRERFVARQEALPSTGEIAAKRDLIRSVSSAVTALREPYRSVVILRYYDGLRPREIAAALDAPVETIRSQLRRARSQLRTRLDQLDLRSTRERSWRATMLPLVGTFVPASTTKGAAVIASSWIAGTVSALALAGGIVWVGTSSDLVASDRRTNHQRVRPAERESVAGSGAVGREAPPSSVLLPDLSSTEPPRSVQADPPRADGGGAGQKKSASKIRATGKGNALLSKIQRTTINIAIEASSLSSACGMVTFTTGIPLRMSDEAAAIAKRSGTKINIPMKDDRTVDELLDLLVAPYGLHWRIHDDVVIIDAK